MKAVFRIANRLRSGAPIPRDFLPIKGLEHLGLVYQSRVFTTPEEFNDTITRLRDPRFPNRGAEFFPYLLTAEDEAKLTAVPVPAPVSSEPADDSAAETQAEWTAPQPGAKYVAAVDPSPEEEPAAESPVFRLEGKSIYIGDERVAGLFGDEKQLRVMAAHAELRPQIEAWLETLTPNP